MSDRLPGSLSRRALGSIGWTQSCRSYEMLFGTGPGETYEITTWKWFNVVTVCSAGRLTKPRSYVTDCTLEIGSLTITMGLSASRRSVSIIWGTD